MTIVKSVVWARAKLFYIDIRVLKQLWAKTDEKSRGKLIDIAKNHKIGSTTAWKHCKEHINWRAVRKKKHFEGFFVAFPRQSHSIVNFFDFELNVPLEGEQKRESVHNNKPTNPIELFK